MLPKAEMVSQRVRIQPIRNTLQIMRAHSVTFSMLACNGERRWTYKNATFLPSCSHNSPSNDSCQSEKMATLLSSLFCFCLSNQSKSRITVYRYIVKWCRGNVIGDVCIAGQCLNFSFKPETIKDVLYGIQILCRRHPLWSYPALLTIADPPGMRHRGESAARLMCPAYIDCSKCENISFRKNVLLLHPHVDVPYGKLCLCDDWNAAFLSSPSLSVETSMD